MDTEGLSSICNGLGYRREDENGTLLGYAKGDYCLDNLKDIQRFLRRDDPQGREVFKQMCKWNVVSHHLIPILENYQNNPNLVINSVKVLVFLTMPVDQASDDVAQQIEYLWHIKAAITRHITIAVIVSLLEDPLEHLECNVFTEDDWKLVQLVLTLFRNILAIQDILLQHKASGLSAHFLHLREIFLELLFQENVMDLILVLTQHLDSTCGYLCQDNFLLLEVFHYIFQGQEPKLVAATYHNGPEMDGGIETSVNTLKSMMEEEEDKRRLIKLRNSTFHSQFSGAFTRLTMDGSRTIFKGNPTTASGNSLKAPKVQRGPLKRIAWDQGILPARKNKILSLLCNFLEQFLLGAYNVLMQSIREDIEKEHHEIQTCDIIIFFHVACFVTNFQHHRFSISKPEFTISPEASPLHEVNDSSTFCGDICGPIAATMNEAMFSLVINKWRFAFDSLKVTNEHKFLSSAGSLLKSMICMLDSVLKLSPEYSNEHQTARVLLYKLFYDQTDQGMTYFLLNLVKCFDTHKQPKSDLADLVETLHTILQLMGNLQLHGTLRVSKKTRKGRKNKLLADKHDVELKKPSQELDNAQTVAGLNDENGVLCSESNSSSTRKEESNMVPLSTEDLDIHLPVAHNVMNNSSYVSGQNVSNDLNDRIYRTEDSSDDEDQPATNEVDLRVSNVIANFANNAVIHKLCWLLRFYKSNSANVNNYTINILQQISDDLELSPMLYQLSVLTIFYDILVDQKSSKCNEYTSIVNFLTKLVRKLLKKLKIQPLLFVELLLWKTRKECHYINAESLLHDVHNLRREVENCNGGEGGLTSAMGVAGGKSIAESLGEDEADLLISQNIYYHNDNEASEDGTENERRSSVLTPSFAKKKLNFGNESEGISSTDHSKRASGRKKMFIFDQEQEMAVRDLYDKYKDDRQCNRLIAEALDPHGKVSPLQISRKLKQLGLSVASRKRFSAHKSFNAGDDQVAINTASSNGSMGLEDTSHVRKRIRAFSKEQELMVRNLFEKFKSHKRCTHMIANALDEDNTYTAAQVSRKLKQLGLHVPRERKKYSEDVEFCDKEEKSDEETLVTLLERCKGKERVSKSKPEASKHHGGESDDEPLSSILLSKGKRGMSKNVKSELEAVALQGDSDDELLSTMLRDVHAQSSPLPATRNTAILSDYNFEEPSKVNKEQQHIDSEGSKDGQWNHVMHDELEDSGDDLNHTTPKMIGSRRKLKMIIDVEDDE